MERGQMTAPAGLRPRCFDSWTPADVGRSYSPAATALYLAILSRPPTSAEISTVQSYMRPPVSSK